MYGAVLGRFSDRQLRVYVDSNPGSRIDLATIISTHPNILVRLLYAVNFPAIVAAVRADSVFSFSPIKRQFYQMASFSGWYILFMVVQWYIVGRLVDAQVNPRSPAWECPTWILLPLKLVTLVIALVIGVVACNRLMTAPIYLGFNGRELEWAAVLWSLIVAVLVFQSLRKGFVRA
jgi:hypothetical protein